ncbi:MAG: VCBS repeat-containing protein, partial [Verrucomicrobia bacterium]|nr:VCBS repeat-containing protein [Verrucomicrobiota bacterium]
EEEFGGTVMNTTAHYTDVSPSMDESNRVGLVVNGHPGATNYLSVFMPDTLLQTWGVTNAETQMNGYLNGIAINHDLMQFTRIEGGSNVVYDVNGDGVGDSGYVIEFGFFFPATTSLKAAAANSVTAEIGVMSEIQYVEGDFDGDGKADPFWPAKSGVLGMWTFWMSSDSYRPSGPYVMMGRGLDPIPVAADFDGDRKADPAMVVNGGWMFWFSSDSYRPSGPYEMSVSGEHVKPVAGDFDGDRKADPAMVANGDWTFWLSSDSYVSSGPYAISATGTDVQPIVGDFDGDGLADPAMVDLNDNYNWTIWPSGDKYVPVGPYEFVP